MEATTPRDTPPKPRSRTRGKTRRAPRGTQPTSARPYRIPWWPWTGHVTFDDVCTALAFQYALLGELIQEIRTSTWRAPTRVPGRRVTDVVGRLIADAEQVVEMTRAPRAQTAGQDALDWYETTGHNGTATGEETLAITTTTHPAGLAARYQTATATGTAILRSGQAEQILGGATTGITLADYAVTRLVGAVVHGLDLADALDQPERVDNSAVHLVSGFLTALAERAEAVPPNADITVDSSGTLYALGSGPDYAGISAVEWISAAVDRRSDRMRGRQLPSSHSWVTDALPLLV
jgi:hypothetical protein